MVLKKFLLIVSGLFLMHLCVAQDGWEYAREIEKRIVAPVFPAAEYRVTDFGAKSGLEYDSRKAFNAAIDRCSSDGGGRVVIPAGKYFVKGSIVLKSNVDLHLSEGTELVFSSDASDYLPMVPTRWEGTELYNYSPLIYAYQAVNIAITGRGVLNGQGTKNIATWKPMQKDDQQELRRMGRTGVPVYERVFGPGHYLRPAFVEPMGCQNVLIEGVSIVDATFWVIHPVYCNNVTVRNVTIRSRNPNSDGCDPESSSNVLIEGCNFDTGDDAIAIKSGRDNDAWRVGRATENVIIRNCTFRSLTNAVCIGSEISGGVRNVFIEDIDVPYTTNALYFKSNLDRGGYIENIFARNITVDSVAGSAVRFEPDYKSESQENFPTLFRGFTVENLTCNYAGGYGIDIRGFERMPVSDVLLRNVSIRKVAKPYVIENADRVRFERVSAGGKEVEYRLPNKTVSLNGMWEVAIGNERPSNYPSRVPVPGIVTMASPKLADNLDGNDPIAVDYDYVWYRLNFDLHEKPYPGAVLRIRAKYNAEVFLNGVKIGYDHHCTYSHAEFDLGGALNFEGANELIVRVGSWNTASSPSKENSAEWWRNTRAPGIWDDVTLELGQPVAVKQIRVLPDIRQKTTHCQIEVANTGRESEELTVVASVVDNGAILSRCEKQIPVATGETGVCDLSLASEMLQYWSAGKEGPSKLYTLNVKLIDSRGKLLSDNDRTFGYRGIEVRGKDVLMNGEKIMFRAENIAFVRALNRWPEAVFDEDWIRGFLRAAIHDYNFNYLRIHLGHAYGKWYDIADQEGIMIQDEWRYMHDDEPAGKEREEAEIEFTRWVRENVNHPSIVAWDQENEGNVRLPELIEKLREYDPSRLWSEEDFASTHVYEYSENIVSSPYYKLSDEKPSTILESCRLWTNEHGLLEPGENFKTSRTASGWGIYYYTPEIIGQLLADLHADLGTHFRAARIQAWAPFALLSGWVNGQNFYLGNIVDSLRPQQNLLVLKKINEPVGTSVDMLQAREWYKDRTVYKPGVRYTKNVFAWNDYGQDREAILTLSLKELSGKTQESYTARIVIPAYGTLSVPMSFTAPKVNGIYLIEPVLTFADGTAAEGPARRIMVASRDDGKLRGMMAFGGSRARIPGGQSVTGHFIGEDLPDAVEKTIQAVAGDGLLDKLSHSDDGNYTVQSTRYESRTKSIVTTAVIDRSGKVLSTRQAEALNYVDLPAPVKAAIVEALEGTVPVDESKIIKSMQNGDTIYEVSVIGSDLRYRLNIDDKGKLKAQEVLKKKPK